MCGIVAVFSSKGQVVPAHLQRAIETISYRGPDARSLWVSPSRKVGLAHARLSIMDLLTGDQPIANRSGQLQVIVNGEFYNFEQIRAELEGRGHEFRTRSDSEIALHLYEDVGPQCLHRLRGEFSFVLWDERDQTLFAARDRFGIKPLYYATINGTLCLASEVKALFALGVPARWDQESFFDSQHFLLAPDQDRSLFQGVYQVPPGHYLLATPGQTKIVRYWDLDYPETGASLPHHDEAEYAEQFRHALTEAIRLRMRADVPVGCYLSGGLDSCAVLGLAATLQSKPIKAFTLSFDRPEYDEEPIAREMAAHAGADFSPIFIKQSDLADHFAESVWHSETLCFNSHGTAKFLLSRVVRDAGYKVVLTGEGSDEILGGYPHFKRDMLLYNHGGQDKETVARLLKELQATNSLSSGFLLPHGDSKSLASVQKVLGFVPSWIETFATRAFAFSSLNSRDFSERFSTRDPYRAFLNNLDLRGQVSGRDPLNQSCYLWSKRMLPSYILNVLGDRMEMAHSVEGRVPYLDHELVGLAARLPIPQKIRGATEKYILRQAAKPVLTDTLFRRQKHPFVVPPASLATNDRLYELLQDTLRGPLLGALPFFDQKKISELLDQIPEMDTAARSVADLALMAILSACVLQERFGLQT